jgi:CubicO group peptidase (beta-lactamase class C family)
MQMNAFQTITQRLLLIGLLWPSGQAIFFQAAALPDPIQSYLQPLVDNHTIAGAVILVATRDHTAYLRPIGFRDLATNTPMPADALFWVASVSKPITATALMMRVDEGKVNLDDPVEKYLPEFKGQKVYRTRPAPSQTAPARINPAELAPADHPIYSPATTTTGYLIFYQVCWRKMRWLNGRTRRSRNLWSKTVFARLPI